jgi:hypothetical protein
MEKDYLVLKRASASRPSGEWKDDDYDVLAEGVIVGRIMKAAASPVETPWLWTLAFGHHEDRTPTHGYAATRDAAMAAFAKSWRREWRKPRYVANAAVACRKRRHSYGLRVLVVSLKQQREIEHRVGLVRRGVQRPAQTIDSQL